MTSNETADGDPWRWALGVAQESESESAGAAMIMLDWSSQESVSVIDLVRGDNLGSMKVFGSPACLELSQQCYRALRPGAHVAMWVPGSINDLGGIVLRLAGFEIRDAISVVTESGVFYWHLGRKPMPGNIIESTLAHGTGGLNIGATRVGSEAVIINRFHSGAKPFGGGAGESFESMESQGRFPP